MSRRDPVGWLLWKMAGPPVRRRVRTAAPFEPITTPGREATVAEFERWQREQAGIVGQADGLPLGRLWITSPFDARIRYNAYACLTILPRHQHRHLGQAEQVRAGLEADGDTRPDGRGANHTWATCADALAVVTWRRDG